MLRYVIFLIALVIVSFNAKGQCTIQGKRVACVNDLVTFSITNSSGTVSSYSWNFGVYGNSSNTNPTVKFTAQGTIIASCTLTLAGGGTCIDTHSIVILSNPIAKSVLDIISDSCFAKNKICMKNLMQKATQDLYSLSLLWGDGNYSNFTAPFSTNWCHTYSDTGVYTQSFELADLAGCKDKFTIKVHVVPSVSASISSTVTFGCDSSKICFTGSATGGNSIKYKWYSVPANKFVSTTNPYCIYAQRGNYASAKLNVSNEFGCKDSVIEQKLAPDSGIRFSLGSHRYCSKQISSGLGINAGELVSWEYNGKSLGKASFITITSAKPGWNVIKMSKSTPCPESYTDSIWVSVLNVKAKLFNDFRRTYGDTTWYEDLSKNAPGSRIFRLWSFGDNFAQQCTTWSKKNFYVSSNCNFSRDSIAGHLYKFGNKVSPCPYVRLMLYDSSTGCQVDTQMQVNRTDFCDPFVQKNKICLDEYVNFSISKGLYNKIKLKNYILTDIKKPRDSIKFYSPFVSYQYKTKGFKSPIFWRYYGPDTVWTNKNGKIEIDYIRNPEGWVADTFKNGVEVMYKPNSDFVLNKISGCNPSSAQLKFKDSIWLYPNLLQINWGDTTIKYTNFTDTFSKLPALFHTYKTSGTFHVTVTMVPKSGCPSVTSHDISFGFSAKFYFKLPCNNSICFTDSVKDFDGTNQWTKTNGLGKLYWDFGDGKKDSGFNLCHTYKTYSTYSVKITAVAKGLCTATYSASIVLSKAVAAIKHQPTIYCSEIRKYFDSSYTLGSTDSAKIVKWNWNFGDGSSPVSVQDPAHIYPAGGVYTVRLIVTTIRGCRDTAYRVFTVLGPQVKANILSDSNGCSPLVIKFGNLSVKTGNFIWEFGDLNNTFYSTQKDTSVWFKYTKPGTYYVHLTGGDSFYNPITGSHYYCSVTYPNSGQNQLRIKVTPGYHSEFAGPDTLCTSDTADFINNSDTTYAKQFLWSFGDGNSSIQPYKNIKYLYKNAGNYKLKLYAYVSGGGNIPCLDTARKQISVLKFTPDFIKDCDKTSDPEFYFKNLAGPDVQSYKWTLINPPDTIQKTIGYGRDLKHDFGFDTGTRIICLRFNSGKYCLQTSCKPIKLTGGFYLANVFTPGILDGLNDTYRVPMGGYESYNLDIFNRWGEKVFHSEDPHTEWNGKVLNTGNELPSGTYFYQLTYKDDCGKNKKTVSGSINLIR